MAPSRTTRPTEHSRRRSATNGATDWASITMMVVATLSCLQHHARTSLWQPMLPRQSSLSTVTEMLLRRMSVAAVVTGALVAVGTVFGLPPSARAQGASPAAPSDLSFTGSVLRWTDNATDESGYRVTVKLGGNVDIRREFHLAAGVTEFNIPSDLLPACPNQYIAEYEVVAVRGTVVSEPVSTGVAVQCQLTPAPAPNLPSTGKGAAQRVGGADWSGLPSVVALLVLGLILGAGGYRARKTPNR
jgi:hypothetical protein